jgi:hypothetical protein
MKALSPVASRKEDWNSRERMTSLVVRIMRSALSFCGDV